MGGGVKRQILKTNVYQKENLRERQKVRMKIED